MGIQDEIKSVLPQGFSLRTGLMEQEEVEAFQDLNFEASTHPPLHTSCKLSEVLRANLVYKTWKIINYIFRGGAKTTAILKVSPPSTLKL